MQARIQALCTCLVSCKLTTNIRTQAKLTNGLHWSLSLPFISSTPVSNIHRFCDSSGTLLLLFLPFLLQACGQIESPGPGSGMEHHVQPCRTQRCAGVHKGVLHMNTYLHMSCHTKDVLGCI
jgi:hypothetical protein